MVVQHNMQAMNASRMLNITTGEQGKTTEKLSSGYRINRAADDAAGLSISEKMRKQIRGLDQASTNASDGVSAVQTAEGALTEVHSMLQRMNELAVQAANGTNSETDRGAIQDEIDQLTTEIDRVATTTKFNESYLLNGDTSGHKSTHAVAAHDAGLAGKLVDNGNGTTTFTLDEKLKTGDKVTIAGKQYEIGAGKGVENYATAGAIQGQSMSVGDSMTIAGKEYTLTNDVKASDITDATNAGIINAAGNTITTADGTVYQYHDHTTDDNSDLVSAGWYKKDEFKNTTEFETTHNPTQLTAIAVEGSTIKLAAPETQSGLKSFNIVKKLEDGDVSAFKLTAANAGDIQALDFKKAAIGNASATIAAGDILTKDGESVSVVGDDYTPISKTDLANVIGSLPTNGTNVVTVSDIDGANVAAYQIARNSEEEDLSAGKITRETLVGLLEEGQRVEVGTGAANKYTIAGVANDGDTITAQQAYNKMAKELTDASSIGADEKAKVTSDNNGSFTIKQGTVSYTDSLTFNLHVGADADMTNKISVDMKVMNSKYLGVSGLNVKDDTGTSATYAIDAISDAIAKVSAQRSELGAVQNRLEHTIANVDNVVENSTAAESRIRDTDMADEMVKYSKNNILAQAGQSMLAQANQATQGVLSILG